MLLPSVANLAVVPLTGAVDTFYVGRMGDALALAGQGAANQVFTAFFFVCSFVPKVTVPLVAKAFAAGDVDGARDRTCDSLFVACVIGLLGTALLVGAPQTVLRTVISPDALAAPFAARYLRLRSLSVIPAAFSAVAFAAFRGTLDVATPLRVSVASNFINLILDPILIFSGRLGFGMGVAGAAVATAVSEVFAGVTYLRLLLRRRLASWSRLARLPDLASLYPLLKASFANLVRTALWNAVMLTRARTAQAMDPTGVAAAAYTISLQLYYVGDIFSVAMQTIAASLVPAALAKSTDEARRVTRRLAGWSMLVGMSVCAVQLAALPILLPLFTPNVAVRQAARMPSIVAALVMLINSPCYTAEGVTMGLGSWTALTAVTAVGLMIFLLTLNLLTPLGLVGIWASVGALNLSIAIGLAWFVHRGKASPLVKDQQA
jgi:putative MATE family efflux protein